MRIHILEIQDEPISNYPEHSLRIPFNLADCCITSPSEVMRHAIKALWDSRWTPGSIAWRVYLDDGTPTDIGENFVDLSEGTTVCFGSDIPLFLQKQKLTEKRRCSKYPHPGKFRGEQCDECGLIS